MPLESPEDVLARMLLAKKERRRALAKLPVEEKFRILVEMQRIVLPIYDAQSRPLPVPREWLPWELG